MKKGIYYLLLALCLSLTTSAFSAGDEEAAELGWRMLESGALLIDVREPHEFEEGHIEGAINAPYEDSEMLLVAAGPDRDRAIVLYCGSGRRAGIAEKMLEQSGYTQVFNATGYGALLETAPE